MKTHLHLIEEDLGPYAPFEEPVTWLSRTVDQLEDEIGRSFRNHSAFDRWLEAHGAGGPEPTFEPDLDLEREVGPDVEIVFTPQPPESDDE